MNAYFRLYDALLRLYPRAYRDDFAAEMRDVFAQSLADSANRHQRLARMLREVLHIPPSAAYQHWLLGRRQPALAYIYKDALMNAQIERLQRRTAFVLFLFCAAFALMIALPFFVYGLHQERWELVMGGFFDPKGYAVYQNSTFYFVSFFVLWLTPLAGAFGVALMVWSALRRCRYLTAGQRRFALFLFVVGMIVVTFPFTPLGRMLFIWLLD